MDARFDALKPQPPVLPDLELATTAAAGDVLSINGLPLLRTPRTVPVSIRVTQAGSCQLVVSELVNFDGIRCVLTDAVTGLTVPLVAGSTYAFAATPGTSQRFRVYFSLR